MRSKKVLIRFVLIYIVYISLGVPDSIIGTAWPAIRADFQVPLSYGSILSVIVLLLAAISSISYSYLEKYVKLGTIMLASSVLTMLGLFMVSVSNHFIFLCMAVIPMGLGAGAVDAAINNYVSKSLTFKHMIWLHGFWGIGAVIGPFIYSISQVCNQSWHFSAFLLALIQLGIASALFVHRSIFNERETSDRVTESSGSKRKNKQGFLSRILYMFLFSGMDVTITLWLATYLIEKQIFTITNVGLVTASYYAMIMLTRFVVGKIAHKVSLSKVMSYSLCTTALALLIVISSTTPVLVVIGVVGLGIGISTLHPLTLYENHLLYEEILATQLTSYQIAAGLFGSLCIPGLVGVLLQYYGSIMFSVIEVIIVVVLVSIRYGFMVKITKE